MGVAVSCEIYAQKRVLDISRTRIEDSVSYAYDTIDAVVRSQHLDQDIGFEAPNEVLFISPISFNHTAFSEKAIFSGCSFLRSINFFHCEFKKYSSFYEDNFGDTTYFVGSSFKKNVSYSDCKFGKVVLFSLASFDDSVDFSNASFGRLTDFGFARFGRSCDFNSVTLDKSTDFSYALFGKIAHFSYLTLTDSSRVIFRNTLLPDTIDLSFNTKLNTEIDLTIADFTDSSHFDISRNSYFKPHLILLYKTDISKLKLDYTHFHLLLPDSILDPYSIEDSNWLKITDDEKISIYESLLNNFNAHGQKWLKTKNRAIF